MNYCNETWKTIVELLNSNIYTGLGEEECIERRKKYGDNKIRLPKHNNIFKTILKSFLKPYTFIMLGALIYLLYFRNIFSLIICGIMVFTSFIIKSVNIFKRARNINYLQRINSSTVSVVRDGVEEIIKCEELVKGDIVVFKKDSLISADLRIIEGKNIKVDERNITGETFLKEKFESKMDNRVSSIAEMKNMLFKGTLVKSGEGYGIVVEIGNKTEMGKMMAVIEYSIDNKHILEFKIEKKYNIAIIISFLVVILIYAIVRNIEGSNDALMLSLTLVLSTPIVVIFTLYIKLLKNKLKYQEKIELLNISVMELIKDIEFIFMDKIGSITKEIMNVEAVYINDNIINKDDVDYESGEDIKKLLDITLLCNNGKYNIDTNVGSGTLEEIAYLRFAANKKAYKSILDARYPRIFDIPMDYDKRVITVVNKYKKGYRASIRGNLDAILDRCTYILKDGVEKEITDEDIERIKAKDYNFSVNGLISQAIAYRNFTYKPSSSENVESNLIFVGVLAMDNPLNEDVKNDIGEIRRRGIIPMLFTEDNKIVGADIGKKSSIIKDVNEVTSGIEMLNLSKDEFTGVLNKTKVFSRVNPEIKSNIINMFVRDRYKIATSGENLSELSNLSISTVGIGKGKAPEIIKKVSDVYIEENYLKGFLNIFDISKDFSMGMKRWTVFSFFLLISQLLVINIFLFINKCNINNYNSIIFFNIFMSVPTGLIVAKKMKEKKYKNKYIIRTLFWTSMILITMCIKTNNSSVFYLMLLGGFIIEHIVVNGLVSFRKINIDMILLVVAMLVWIISVTFIVHITNIKFGQNEFVIIIAMYIICGLIEFFLKRWQ